MKKLLFAGLLAVPFVSTAQDNLIKTIEANKAADTGKKWHFTPVIDLTTTPVKNQGSSGTCWSYSGNSFLESEMIKAGRQPVEISQIYTARKSYEDKADRYVRLHGNLAWGDGGAAHDVINMYRKYGAVPQTAYTGLQYGTSKNKFGEMQAALKGMLDGVVKNPNGKLTPVWKKAFTAVIDTYLGADPKEFTWNGKKYTPQSFAKDVVGLNADDYVEVSSFTDAPYYTQTELLVPDNWSNDKVYNVKMDDLTGIIDNALKNGYSIVWATDVSEKYFSWKNGVAFVPEKDWEDMDEKEQKALFNGPQKERAITPESRQMAFDNYTTTDDHGMHIVGISKDQTGQEYYKVKNSWGDKNDNKGYIYVSKPYVQYKTTALLLNKAGIPKDLRKNMGI